MHLVSFGDRLSWESYSQKLLYLADKFRGEAERSRCENRCCLQQENTYELKGVNFSPRCHKISLATPKMFFSDNKQPSSVRTGKRARTNEFMRRSRDADTAHAPDRSDMTNGIGEHTCADFLRYFKGQGKRDGLVEKALDYRKLVGVPYINPQPHNFRLLDEKTLPELVTRLTPDPFDINLRLKAVRSQINSYPQDRHWPQLERVGANINPKFLTRKKQESKFDTTLWLPKGRYSPAFHAHDALLDRIARNISIH